MERQNAAKQASGKGTSRKARNYIILSVEVLLLVMMVGVLWFVTKFTDEEEGIQRVEITTEDIVINEGVKIEVAEKDSNSVEEPKGPTYRTIALFGLDSTIGELTKGTRSDTIMVASINNETKEVRIMSVYRDTYLNLGNDTYNKCNAAYARGGAKQAISMLNMNLDLDITDFVAVGFKGVMDTVNAVGGVMIDVDEKELKHINDYQMCMAEDMKIDYVKVTETGYQKLNGLQAVAYCRIRYSGGDDYKRTERQREVLQAILEEAKNIDVATLTKLVDNVFADFYTSVDLKEIVTLLSDIGSYTLIDEGGFPTLEYRANATIGNNVGASIICTDLAAAVSEFHERFFGQEDYEVSEALTQISAQINTNTAPFLKN